MRIESLTRIALLGTITPGTEGGVNANEDIGVNFFKNNPNIYLSGRGIAIAIISSGIDYLHPDFINADGTSKILYLWDQTKEGNPPKGYYIGTEYTREQINEAIANNDSSLSTDEEGYGTILSGICAGLGNVNSEYAGVAEDAQLIVVKLEKIDGYYNNAMSQVASQYVYEKAFQSNMPLVINYANGTTSLAGISTRTIIEQSYFTRGVCSVSAAGDEGNTQTHTSGKILASGDVKEIEFEVTSIEEQLEIQIWIEKPDTAIVTIVSPSGEESKSINVSDFNTISGIFDFENTNYSITYIYPTIFSGQQQAIVNMTSVKSGIWKIRLTGDYISNGNYDAYLPNRVFLNSGTRFRNPDPSSTILYPATFSDNITVGAYDSINRGLWQGSSRGPTISGLLKPDLIAPGVNIIGPYPGGGYGTITGTAPAAAYTSGCVSMFMQYVLLDMDYRSKAFVQNIRTIFRIGSIRSEDILYPNNNTGYGVLNMRNTMEVFR